MRPIRSISGYYLLKSLIVLLPAVFFLALSDPSMIFQQYGRVSTEDILLTPAMCAPINQFKVGLSDPFTPRAPYLDKKWDHTFPISVSSPEAQDFFDQGLFYMYAFNHAEAERSFREAVRLDPACAMAHWGVALALGPNINRGMPTEHIKDAWQFSRRALQLSDQCADHEKELIKALSKRYRENPPSNRAELDQAYAEAMREVAKKHPENTDIATLFAESLMDLMPWNYWEKDGTPKPATKEMHALLDKVLEIDPKHPGANHYYIHSVEAIRPELASGAADRLRDLEYGAGHLIHMPGHIYVRLGRYHDSAIANQRAIEIDEDYIESCQAQGFYPALYYPHNIHFLWFSASMEGRSQLAIDAARKVAQKIPQEMLDKSPGYQKFLTIPLYALVQFGQWKAILKEPKPDQKYAYTTLFWHYARGMAYAKNGKIKLAKKALKKVKKLKKSKNIQSLKGAYFPAAGMSEIAYHILAGELEGRKGKDEQKIDHLRQAVAIQDSFIYMEPPFFYFPVRQALGAALLKTGKAAESADVYRLDLEKFPENGWSLYGLYQSQRLLGQMDKAQKTKRKFETAWQFADVELSASVME